MKIQDKIQQYLSEEHIDTKLKNLKKEQILLFKNPSSDELKEIRKTKGLDVRFIIDFFNKNLWVWYAFDILHSDIWKEHIKEDTFYMINNYVFGTGKIIGNHIEFVNSDLIDTKYLNKNKTYMKKIKKLKLFTNWSGKDDWTKIFFKKNILSIMKEKYMEVDNNET